MKTIAIVLCSLFCLSAFGQGKMTIRRGGGGSGGPGGSATNAVTSINSDTTLSQSLALSNGTIGGVTAPTLADVGGGLHAFLFPFATGTVSGVLHSNDWREFKGSALRTNYLYVSTSGSDAAGVRNSRAFPYQSIGAAKTNASSGDVIVVGPGIYNETDLLKAGVNYDFSSGATVQYTGSSTRAIFDDWFGKTTNVISGSGSFINNTTTTNATANLGTVLLTNLNSYLWAQGHLLSGTFTNTPTAGAIVLYEIGASSLPACTFDFDAITLNGGAAAILSFGYVYATVRARYITSQRWGIELVNSALGGGSIIYVSAETIGGDRGALNYGQNGGSDRLWVECKEIQGGNGPTLLVTNAGRAYLTAQKIYSSSGTITTNIIVSGGGQAWVTAQKLSDTDGPLVDVADGFLYLSAQQVQPLASLSRTAPWPGFYLRGGTNTIQLGDMRLNNQHGFIVSGGSNSLQFANIIVPSTNTAINVSGGSLAISGGNLSGQTNVHNSGGSVSGFYHSGNGDILLSNVGIGTNAPPWNLTVSGTNATFGRITLNSTNLEDLIAAYASNRVQVTQTGPTWATISESDAGSGIHRFTISINSVLANLISTSSNNVSPTVSSLTVTGASPGTLTFANTNGVSFLTLSLNTNAVGTNKWILDNGITPAAGDGWVVHSVGWSGTNQVIVFTNIPVATRTMLNNSNQFLIQTRVTNYAHASSLAVDAGTYVAAFVTNTTSGNVSLLITNTTPGTSGTFTTTSDSSARTFSIFCDKSIVMLSTNETANSTQIVTTASKKLKICWAVDLASATSTNVTVWAKSQP